MKPTIKTTALAILISLLSACKLTENSGSDTTDNTNKTQINNPTTPTETQVVVAEKTDKNGEEWRHIRVAGKYLANGQEQSQGQSQTAFYQSKSGWQAADKASNDYFLNLDDNNFKQGINKGVIDDIKITDFYGQTTMSLVNYLVINQPYSSYGVLFTSVQDVEPFYLGQTASIAGQGEYTVVNQNGWTNEVLGQATYKGEVIASISRIAKFDGGLTSVSEDPKIDGTITINADFKNGAESTVSAVLHSKALGEVNLPETTIILDQNGAFNKYNYIITVDDGCNTCIIKTNVGNFGGGYEGQFAGKDFNDVVGSISLSGDRRNVGDVNGYRATFGGTKQK